MSTEISLKSAKSFSGTVYLYPAATAGEFLRQLAADQNAPIEVFQMMSEHFEGKVLQKEDLLREDYMYFIFVRNNLLREWIQEEKLNWYTLSSNPAAIHLLEQNLDKVRWTALSCNPAAIHLLEQNLDKVNWMLLSSNPAAIHLLEQNLDKVNWILLSSNPAAIHLLEQNLDKVNWQSLSRNTAAIHLLEQNLDKVNWEYLSGNPAIFYPKVELS